MTKLTCLDCTQCKKRYNSHYCIAESDNPIDDQKLTISNLVLDNSDCSLFENKK